MKKAIKFIFTLLTVTAFFTLTVIIVSAANPKLPIELVVTDSKNYSYSIAAEKVNGSYTFFVPGSVDLSKVTVKYTGKKMLCDDSGEASLYRGDTSVFKISGDKIDVREYDADTKKYTSYSAKIMQGGSLGSVYITLDGGDDTFKDINASKNNIGEGKILVLDESGKTLYNGEMSKMKGHGLTSFNPSHTTNVKNSYNIKIANKAELVEDSGKNKKWVLLSPRMSAWDRDVSGFSQIAAFNTYNGIIGKASANIRGEYVDLYVNGQYHGLYILVERMNRGGAIDVFDLEEEITDMSGDLKTVRSSDKKNAKDPAIKAGIREYRYDKNAKLKDSKTDFSGGYVLEVMCETYEGCGFITKNGLFVSIKSPEACTKEMVRYIAEYVQNFENAIYSDTGYDSNDKHYTEYADIKSLADTVLTYSFYMNFEYFRTSTYMYKDTDEILHFGPAWDFETSADTLKYDETLFGTTNGFTYNVNQQYIWSEQLWRHGDFMSYMTEENELMKSVLSQQLGYSEAESVRTFESITQSAAGSADMDFALWRASNFNDVFEEYIEAIGIRYEHWYGTLWNSEKYILGLGSEVIRNEDGTVTIKAVVTGQNDGMIRWYKKSADDPEKLVAHAMLFNEITVPEDGTLYYYTVEGPNNAYYDSASGEIFSDEKIKMTSGGIAATYVEPEPEPTPETDEGNQTEVSGCDSSASALFAVIMSVFILPVLIKKKR